MKDKILNFLIIFLLTFFIVNTFFSPEEDKTKLSKIVISSISSSYTIPNPPKLNVENFTEEVLMVNPCNDFVIRVDGEIVDIKNDQICKDIEILAGEGKIIDYALVYESFFVPWTYQVEVLLKEKKYLSQFEIWTKWFWGKLFSSLFYAPLYNLIASLISASWYSLGWWILLITVLIRFALLVPQHQIMVSQKKMQKIQPKIKEIQDKYKWDHQRLGQELMGLYKKEDVNPMWSCLPMMIQMPILIVIYQVIMSINDPTNTYYLYSFMSDFSIWKIATNFYGIELLWTKWIAGIALWIFVWVIQFIQMKLSMTFKEEKNKKKWVVLEKKKWAKEYESFMPDPEVMNKFMLYWMPWMIGMFTYSLIAWLWLYWWMSTFFMILQQIVVNKVIKK